MRGGKDIIFSLQCKLKEIKYLLLFLYFMGGKTAYSHFIQYQAQIIIIKNVC